MRPPLRILRAAICIGLLGVGSSVARACLWDRDTVSMEAMLFPGVFDTMTGQFPRHSVEYYRWRATSAGAALVAAPDRLDFYDDVAVALHKQGKHQAAIELMERARAKDPARYETLSNLATFKLYAGDLAGSRLLLQDALRINPDAHFGREKYQLWLVEMLMLRDPAAATSLDGLIAGLPESSVESVRENLALMARLQINRAEGWTIERGAMRELNELERKAALQGVLGMMRFADFDNPLLSLALGDLLAVEIDGKRPPVHAALAYELASTKVTPEARDKIQRRAVAALPSWAQPKGRLEHLETLDKGLAQGRELQRRIRADEIAWIAARADVDAKFRETYLARPDLLELLTSPKFNPPPAPVGLH